MSEGRWCYYVSPDQDTRENGGFCPSIVVEGVPGHHPLYQMTTPWVWGKTLIEAEKACREYNLLLGMSSVEVELIILSSMGAQLAEKEKPP